MDVDPPLAAWLLALALALLVGVVVLISLLLLGKWLRHARLSPPDLHLARKLFPACAVLIGMMAARAVVAALALETAPLLEIPLSVGMIWSAAYLVSRIIWMVTQLVSYRFHLTRNDQIRTRRVRTQVQFVAKLAYAAVVFLGVASTLLLFDGARRFGESLLASAGVAGIIIGFAAQKSLANLIAGFQIAFTQPLRLEDVLVVEGEWGWVEEINLTYVVIRIWDRRRLVLPITYFVEKPFQNWTRNSGQIIGGVTLEVAHRVPFAELERELFRLLDATPMWDRDVQVLQMVEVAERFVTVRALMTASDSPTCWDLRCHVRRGLVEFLERNYPESLPVLRVEGERDVVRAFARKPPAMASST